MMLYVIGNRHYGWYKIGVSSNPDKRINEIRTGCPVPVEIVLVAETDEAEELERMLHLHFASQCMSREWFVLDDEDLEYIAEIGPGWTKQAWEQAHLFKMDGRPVSPEGWREFLGEWFYEKYPELV